MASFPIQSAIKAAASTIGAALTPITPLGAPSGKLHYMDPIAWMERHSLKWRGLINVFKEWASLTSTYKAVSNVIYDDTSFTPTTVACSRMSFDVTFLDVPERVFELYDCPGIFVEDVCDITNKLITLHPHYFIMKSGADAGNYFYEQYRGVDENPTATPTKWTNPTMLYQDYMMSGDRVNFTGPNVFYPKEVVMNTPYYDQVRANQSHFLHINPDQRIFNARIQITGALVRKCIAANIEVPTHLCTMYDSKDSPFNLTNISRFISVINFINNL